MEDNKIKSDIKSLSKRIIELNNSDDTSMVLRNKLRSIDTDPDLKEYLLLRSGRDETEFNKLKSDYLQILYHTLDILESLEYTTSKNKELIEELMPLKKELQKNKINSVVMVITAFICVFWGLYTVNPEAGKGIIEIFKHLIKLLTFGIL